MVAGKGLVGSFLNFLCWGLWEDERNEAELPNVVARLHSTAFRKQ